MSDAFYKCNNLTEVIISDGVESISDGAFEYCENLTGVEIPNSVTDIGDSAFKSCSDVELVNYGGTKEQWDVIKMDNQFSNPSHYGEGAPINYNYVSN